VRILVTGATGFIASHLLPALVGDEHEVFALGHVASRIPEVGAVPLERDLRLEEAFEGLPDVEAVVYLAQANVTLPEGADDLIAVNTTAPVRLLAHCRRSGARSFIYASSASVYGFGDRPWSEDDPPQGRDLYAATKLAAERLIAAYDGELSGHSLRLVAPYGSGQSQRLIPRLVESVRLGRPVTLNAGGRPLMNPIFIDDVVEVVRSLLGATPSRVLNVGGDETVSIRELAEEIGRLVGTEPVFVSNDGPVAGDLVCDNTAMHHLLGERSLTGLRAGLSSLALVPEPSRG
jgi:UDP-glucose 4-epimerase